MDSWLKTPSASAPCTVIAEVAQAHDGSLGMAHAFIDAIAPTGAHAIKFQTHIASAESTPLEPWRKKFSLQDASRYDYWRRMEFTLEQWQGLRKHADEKGLMFLSSPFSMQAMDLLAAVGVAGWKVASGEVANIPMLQRMAADNIPVILSSGMSDYAELDNAAAIFQSRSMPLAVLQCATRYPCPPEEVGLNVMQSFRNRYQGAAIGLSDHSATVFPGLAAVTLGAQVIEVHATLSRDMFGPDVTASLTIAEIRQLVEGVRFTEAMLSSPVDKASLSQDLKQVRAIFTKSLVAAGNLPAGHVLIEGDLAAKKPGDGVSVNELSKFIGKALKRQLQRDEKIDWNDI